MLQFHKISEFENGTISKLLHEAYKSLHEEHPMYYDENNRSFNECNDFFYENINIGDDCCIISTFNDVVIGMCCWDPRHFPIAEIGHNCILPKYRGRKFGKQQLSFVIKRLKNNGFTKVIVSTNILCFYIPAQKQYESVGFIRVNSEGMTNNDADEQGRIYYELELL